MAKNDQSSSTDGMSRKERRAAERAARKGGGGSTSTIKSSTRSGPSMMVISVGALIIGLVVVAALVALSGGFGDDEAAAITTPTEPAPAEDLRVVARSLGEADAPVLVEAYEDPQCPACGLFTRNIEPLLVAGPVTDGTVLFTYKDYAFLGPESLDAAVAMRAADALDGKFWDMHQIIFENQISENQGAFSQDRLADMAVAIGLDREAFLAELDNPEHLEAVEAERAEGEAAGVNSTPSLVVNGELIRGVPQWEDLRSAIETAAEEAQAEA